MPEEPNITDLQRKMRTLESRLAKEQDNGKALRAERDKLKRRVGTLERQKERLDTQVGELKATQKNFEQRLKVCEKEKNKLSLDKQALVERESALIQENRKLAERLSTAGRDTALFREKAEKAAEDIKVARKETAEKHIARYNADVGALKREKAELESEMSLRNKQLARQGKVPLLPPEKVALLMGDLVERFGGRLPGMKLATGELKLKVAFGEAGDVSGFVIPTTDADPKIKENLHELTVRFDRAAIDREIKG